MDGQNSRDGKNAVPVTNDEILMDEGTVGKDENEIPTIPIRVYPEPNMPSPKQPINDNDAVVTHNIGTVNANEKKKNGDTLLKKEFKKMMADLNRIYHVPNWERKIQRMTIHILDSYDCWSEELLKELDFVEEGELVSILEDAGLMKVYQGNYGDVLLEYYREHERIIVEARMKARRRRTVPKDNETDSKKWIDTERMGPNNYPIIKRVCDTDKNKREQDRDREETRFIESDSPETESESDTNTENSSMKNNNGTAFGDGPPDDDDDNDSSDNGTDYNDSRHSRRKIDDYDRRRQPNTKKENKYIDNHNAGQNHMNILKMAIAMIPKLKWSGPNDSRYSTAEFIEHYNKHMKICNAPSSMRIDLLSLAFTGDALDTYTSHIENNPKYENLRKASIIIHTVGQKLETPEFKARKRNEWTNLTISDFIKSDKSTLQAFNDMKRHAKRLQKILGQAYQHDTLLCDFFRRACEDELFWRWTSDYGTDTTSDELCGNIQNAILKQSRMKEKQGGETISNATDMTKNRWGNPYGKKNPTRNGKVLTCNGCGSDSHFYRNCPDPNKKANSDKRFEKINKMKSVPDKKNALKTFHMQIDFNAESDSEKGTSDEEAEDAINTQELTDQVLASNFFETEVLDRGYEELYHHECMENSTRHAFFQDTKTSFNMKEVPTGKVHPKSDLRYPSNKFFGVMIDNGSTGSLCSVPQLEAYRKFTGNPTPVRRLKNHICISAHGRSRCIGIAKFKFPYGSDVITFDAPIVEGTDQPLIIGLSDQDRLGTHGADQKNNLISFGNGPKIPIKRDLGHLWIRWNYETECLFTEKELTKLHYRFGHPGLERMHNFLKRVKPEEVNEETRGMLKDIRSRCKECQHLSPKPYVIKVSVPKDDILFNSEVVLDIMYIQGRPVLHCVDKATNYQAARFITGISTEEIWRTFMEMWCLIYLGPPDNIRHDQGSQFVAGEFQKLAAEAGITCRPVGFESANAMGIGERYHGPLRRTFLKLQSTYGTEYVPEPLGASDHKKPTKKKKQKEKQTPAKDPYLLSITVMCINSTVGPDGICPTLLVFGAMPKLPLPGSAPSAVPNNIRMSMIATAKEEYMNIIGKIRLRQAQKSFVPKTPPLSLKVGDKVLVYREKPGTWEPRKFVSRDENVIYIQEPDGSIQPYGKSKVMEFKEGTYFPGPDLYGLTPENNIDTVPNEESEKEKNGTDDDKIEDDADVDTGYFNKDIDDILFQSESFYTVVMKSNKDKIKEFEDAISTELEGLKAKGVFNEVQKSSLPKNATMIKAKLILSIKEPGEVEERKKARIVAQAVSKLDPDKSMLMTYSPTVGKNSIRLMLAIALGKGLNLFTRDISQAYVSTGTELLRTVYLTPPKELKLDPEIVWQVKKPLYGLPESGVHWFETYVGHHEGKLGMSRTEVDPCLLFKKKNKDLESMVCVQVDDTLVAGTERFAMDEDAACKIFESKGQQHIKDGVSTKFNGQHVHRRGDYIYLHQNSYIDRLPTGKIPRTPKAFQSVRGSAQYVSTCTRPDIACAVNQSMQTVPESTEETDFKRLEYVLKRLRDNKFELKVGHVNIDTAEIRVYADASFATNKDLSSQLGYVILLADAKGNCSILSWCSMKCRRVTRSVLAAELYSVAHGYDLGFATRHTIQNLLGKPVKLRVYTDSKTLFDSITAMSQTTEKRLLIDIYGLREAYRNGDIDQLGWIRSDQNIADALTKDLRTGALHDVMRTHQINTVVSQWVTKGPIPPRS